MSVGPATTYSNAASLPEWYRLHVCLDGQFDEAKRLLEDPNYQVKAPVDVEEFEETMERLGANREIPLRLPERTMNWLIGGAIVVIAVCFAAYAITST